MCTSKATHDTFDPFNERSKGSGIAELNKTLDPIGYNANKSLNSSVFPTLPTAAKLPDAQESKSPDINQLNRNRKNYNKDKSGTLLTSPSGVERTQQAFGATLLGG